MPVSVEGCSPDSDAVAAFEAGLVTVGVDADVRVVGDFVGTVRHLTGSSSYSADRGAGVVGARTLKFDAGTVVVVNWEPNADRTPAELERLTAHEAGHVLLYSRGEHVSGYQDLVDGYADWLLMCLFSYAAEEYRIEAGLTGFGYPGSSAATAEHVAVALSELNEKVVSAVVLPDRTVAQIRDVVMGAQDVFTKVLAYAAGAGVAEAMFDPPTLNESGVVHWADYVGDGWAERLAVY